MKSISRQNLKAKITQRDYYPIKLLIQEVKKFTTEQHHINFTNGVVVDLGAGSQPYRHLFVSKDVNYVPCDIEPSQGATHLINPADQSTNLPSKSAGCVCSFQVLEHVRDVQAYLKEAKRLLCDDGTLFLSTHGVWLFHPHPTDYWRWTKFGLIEELENAGFEIIKITGIVGPLAWTTQFRLLGYCVVLAKLGWVGQVLGKLITIVMNIRIVIEDRITPKEILGLNSAIYVVQAKIKSIKLEV